MSINYYAVTSQKMKNYYIHAKLSWLLKTPRYLNTSWWWPNSGPQCACANASLPAVAHSAADGAGRGCRSPVPVHDVGALVTIKPIRTGNSGLSLRVARSGTEWVSFPAYAFSGDEFLAHLRKRIGHDDGHRICPGERDQLLYPGGYGINYFPCFVFGVN